MGGVEDLLRPGDSGQHCGLGPDLQPGDEEGGGRGQPGGGEDDADGPGLRDGAVDRRGCPAEDTFAGGNSGSAGGCGVGSALGATDDHP